MRITAFLATLLLALIVLSTPPQSSAQIGITVGFGPPALPVYDLPVCPGDGYLWTPGYWAWDTDDSDYYWVPGTWVQGPEVGFLWTPPWWGWNGGAFLFHEGFWGPHIGFYGGINYGFGYFGVGFVGGRWQGGQFFYNRDVLNINVTNIHNVYNEHVNITVNHISYNGGAGGIVARANAEEEMADRDRHIAAVAAQTQHIEAARANRDMRASVNQGRPAIAATSRPGEFSGHDVVASREAGAPYHAPAEHAAGGNGAAPREENGGRTFTHPNDLPALEHPAAPNTGNAKQDQKYQKQQDKLYTKQTQQRQQLQARQDQEHQQAQQSHASDSDRQQMEQRHQQQTQHLQEQHTQQRQQLQTRQAPAKR